MHGLDATLQHIEDHVRQLIDENVALRRELDAALMQSQALKEQLNELNINHKNTEEKLNNYINQREQPTLKNKSTEIELKINKIISSIDKSLALLNHQD